MSTQTFKRFAAGAAAACVALAVSACATLPSADQTPLCAGAGLVIDAGFAAGGRHDCVITPDGGAVVSVNHEPVVVEGVNPSPWFAFRVTSDRARAASIVLDYTDYTHRYAPQVSTDGETWTPLPPDRIVLNERRTRAALLLDLPRGDLFVAGQPLSPSLDNLDWTRRALALSGLTETRYGASIEGRPLIGFAGGGASGDGAVVFLTRQHPPETSGQDAYRGFVERLVERDDAQARAFRASHRFIIAPMPNPDGVDNGNWRTNQGGVDLNRDWRETTQPETKSLTDWIKRETADRQVVAMLDFHSTDRTVIYAPPLDAPSPTVGWLNTLKSVFDVRLSAPPPWTYSHTADGGTSKAWALETLKAPGVTVELWDQIPPSDARALGAAVADALIQHFTQP